MANRVGGAHTCYLSFLAHGSVALVLITFLKLLSASTPKASFLLSSLSLHLEVLLYLVFLSTVYLCWLLPSGCSFIVCIVGPLQNSV